MVLPSVHSQCVRSTALNIRLCTNRSQTPEHRAVAGALAQVGCPELLVGQVERVTDAQLQVQ